MEATRREKLKALFEQALALPPDEHVAFLDQACAGDAARRADLDSLLAHYEEALPWYASLNDVGFLRWDGLPYLGSSYLRRAEIYEHLGETEKAIDYYTRLVELWKDTDPELQRWVDDAQQRLNRLLEDTVREPDDVAEPGDAS